MNKGCVASRNPVLLLLKHHSHVLGRVNSCDYKERCQDSRPYPLAQLRTRKPFQGHCSASFFNAGIYPFGLLQRAKAK